MGRGGDGMKIPHEWVLVSGARNEPIDVAMVKMEILDAMQTLVEAVQRYEDGMTDEDMNNVLKAYRQLKETSNGNK
jgi:hypothetical protein